jgi:hypothetical protein
LDPDPVPDPTYKFLYYFLLLQATDIPLPSKVKQEMRKQEKQRKKQEQDKLKVGKDDPPALKSDPENRVAGSTNLNKTVDAKALKEDSKGAVEDKTVTHLAESVEQLALTKKNEQKDELRIVPAEKAKTDPKNEPLKKDELKSHVPSAADTKPKKDLSVEEQAAIKTAREAQKAAKAAAKAAAAQKKVTVSLPDGTGSPLLPTDVKSRKDGKEESGKNVEGKSATEEKSATEVGRKQSGRGEAMEDVAEGKSKAELKAERRAKQEAQRAAKSQVEE